MQFALGAAFLGLFFFAVGAGSFWQSRSRRRERERWIRVGGWVVGYRLVGLTSYPILRFVLPSGETIDAVSEFGANVRFWTEGEVVALYYDPARPQNATVDHGVGDALVGVMEYVGLGLAAFGLLMLLSAVIGAGLSLSGPRF
jgi:hypothetical protein